jgi:hypothetical protein
LPPLSLRPARTREHRVPHCKCWRVYKCPCDNMFVEAFRPFDCSCQPTSASSYSWINGARCLSPCSHR